MPKPLTTTQVARMLKARGLKAASPAELVELTRMMNADREEEERAARELAAKRRADEKARLAHSKAVDRFMAQFVGDPEPRKKKR